MIGVRQNQLWFSVKEALSRNQNQEVHVRRYEPCHVISPTGLLRSEKNIWKMKFFPAQGKFREFCGWSGKLKKDLESRRKVREFENK